MNKSTLEEANKLVRTIDALDDLNFVLCAPYPQFSCHDRDVNSASFDEKTRPYAERWIKWANENKDKAVGLI